MFLINDAMAEGTATQAGGWESLLPLVLLFVVFYFLLIRPQQKKVKAHKELVKSLGKGDEVVTYGGLAGKILALGDIFIEIEIDDNVKVKIERTGIARVLPKGSLENV